METNKNSKKALRSLISDSMHEVITKLELPAPSKKIAKLIQQNSKKIAAIYSDMLKREEKRKKKAEKFLSDSVNGKPEKRSVKAKRVKVAKPASV